MAEPANLTDLIREFLSTLSLYLRQRGREFVEDIAVEPIRRGAVKAGLLAVAMGLGCAGAVFLAIGLMLLLAELLGSTWAAFLVVAAAGLIAAGVLIFFVTRSGRKEVAAKDEKLSDEDNA